MALRIAIVEDHPALREGLELLLGHRGVEVVGCVGDVAAGERLILESDPDVAIVDITLGAQSGIDLTRRLLERDPHRAVVLYTGSAELDVLYSGLDSGARGYALKDGAPDELMEAIEAVASGGTYLDPRLRPVVLSRPSTDRQSVLSPREREIMDYLAQGFTGEQVAEQLVLSAETVKTHIRNAMQKLEASTRAHAIAIALREGYISPPPERGVPA